jgi:hypothetical protein
MPHPTNISLAEAFVFTGGVVMVFVVASLDGMSSFSY